MFDIQKVNVDQLRTLILNADMRPQSIFPLYTKPARDAIVDVLEGRAVVVEEYDRPVLCENLNINWASVIMYKTYHHYSHRVPLTRETLYYRDGGCCSYCGRELHGVHEVTIDHVHPASLGGAKVWCNVVSACKTCNGRKGNKLPKGQWKPKIQPFEPNYWQILNSRKEYPITIKDECWNNYLTGWKTVIQ